MCDFNSNSDLIMDTSDLSTDISEPVDTDIDSENLDIEIDDTPDDIVEDFSDDSDFEEISAEIEDVSEDTLESETEEMISDFNNDTFELEEDIDDELLSDYEESSEAIEENGYEYRIDSEGRVSEIEGDLTLEKGKRDLNAQREAGGEFRRDTDDGGHFIGNRFNGIGGDINMFAQDSNLNRGGYKSMENEWDRELGKGNDVHVKIDPIYQDRTERPHVIMGEYTVTEDGNEMKEYFSFTNENLRSEEFNLDDYDFEFEEEKNNK